MSEAVASWVACKPCKAIFTADYHILAGNEATVASCIPESYTVPSMFCVNLRFISAKMQENCNTCVDSLYYDVVNTCYRSGVGFIREAR